MSQVKTATSAPSPALPPQWEASLAKLVESAPDLGTLHDVNVAKLRVLSGIHDCIAAIASDVGQTKTVALSSDTTDALAKAMSKVLTTDFEQRFAGLRQTLEEDLAKGLVKAGADIETLKVIQARSEETATAFRIETLESRRRTAEAIDRLGLRTDFAVAESEALNEATQERQETLEAEVAELVQPEKTPPARARRRGSSYHKRKG